MTIKHGMRYSGEYSSWDSMIQRCTNPNRLDWEHYGGRGISICDRWRDSFISFYEDMGPRPEGTTLDRIDNSGNYEPGNCRWATKEEQLLNRRKYRKGKPRSTRKLTVEEAREIRYSSATLKELSIKYGVDGSLISRIRTGKAYLEEE